MVPPPPHCSPETWARPHVAADLLFTGPEGNLGSQALTKYALSLTEGELAADRWNCPSGSYLGGWGGTGAGERQHPGVSELTGDLPVSSIYRSHFLSTYTIKWETGLDTEEMMPCHSQQPAELSPLHRTVHWWPESDEEGSRGGGRGLIPGLKSEDNKIPSGTQIVPYFCFLGFFFVSLPEMSGLPKGCLPS